MFLTMAKGYLEHSLKAKSFDSRHPAHTAHADLVRFVLQMHLFSLNIFIFHGLRNKFIQLILNSRDSASLELHQYSRRMCGPMKIPKLTPAPRARTRDLMILRPTRYLRKSDTALSTKPTFHTVRLISFFFHYDSFCTNKSISLSNCFTVNFMV